MAAKQRGEKVRLEARVSPKLHARVVAAAADHGLSVAELIKAALARFVHRPAGAEQWAEVHLSARGDSTVDQLMEIIATRQPIARDFMAAGTLNLDHRLRRAIRDVLPPAQARRVELRLQGWSYERIGDEEGCSKQAAQASVQYRALPRLQQSPRFLAALVKTLQREQGLDIEEALEAVDVQDLIAHIEGRRR